MSTTKRAPMQYSVRMDQKTSWGMQAKFVRQADAESFAKYLANRLRAAGELVIGVFHKNTLLYRVDIQGRLYRVTNGKIDRNEHTDGISKVTPIPPEVTQSAMPI